MSITFLISTVAVERLFHAANKLIGRIEKSLSVSFFLGVNLLLNPDIRVLKSALPGHSGEIALE